MGILVKLSEAKKSSNSDIIATMKKLSEIIKDRELNNPVFDIDHVCREILSSDDFTNPANLRDIFLINNSMIGIPSVPPVINGGTRKDGTHIIPLIHLPGQQPYQAYIQDTETYIYDDGFNLRGPRKICIHKVIPGMIISLHHYETKGGVSERVGIYVHKIIYDDDNNVASLRLPEKAGMVKIPNEDSIRNNRSY